MSVDANNPVLASLPVGDWQFWVASVIAIGALWVVINSVVPADWLPWKRKTKSTRASLTISAKRNEDRTNG
jgi:hypothetical protein